MRPRALLAFCFPGDFLSRSRQKADVEARGGDALTPRDAPDDPTRAGASVTAGMISASRARPGVPRAQRRLRGGGGIPLASRAARKDPEPRSGRRHLRLVPRFGAMAPRASATSERRDGCVTTRARDARDPFSASFDVEDGDFSPFVPSSTSSTTSPGPPSDSLADETGCAEAPNSGSVLGAVALITGSTVGAGILALPETIAPAGIGPSSAVLVGCWALLVCEALLLAEVNVAIMRERDEYRLAHGRGHSPVIISLSEMAGRTLGDVGAAGTTGAYLFLCATLLVAYIAKSGNIVSDASSALLPEAIPSSLAATGFTMGMWGALSCGGVRLADAMNRGLTLTLLATFAALVAGGAASADWSAADWMGDWSAAPETVPVVFLALVYHDLVPVVCGFLAGDVRKIRTSILLGSSAPLLMFLSWDAVALASAGDAAGDPLAALMQGGDGAVAAVVAGFSFCAISTSFLGTAIGLGEFAQPRLERWASDGSRVDGDRADGKSTRRFEGARRKIFTRAATYGLMLAPPAFVAVTNPDVFLPATNFAGAYCMSAMFGILPPVMAFRMRRHSAARLARRESEGRGGLGVGDAPPAGVIARVQTSPSRNSRPGFEEASPRSSRSRRRRAPSP